MNEVPKQFSYEVSVDEDRLRNLTDEELQTDVEDFIDRSHEYEKKDQYSKLNCYIQEVDRRELPSDHPLSKWRQISLPHLNRLNPEPDAKNLEGGRYGPTLEEAYQNGGPLYLPELEVFGHGKVDMQAVSEFSLELVDFVEQKEQEVDEEELEHLYRFAQRIEAEFFSASPSLINYIPLTNRLQLMTRATRSKVIQGTFGGDFVGETVYDISFMNDQLDEITMKVMEDLSVPEKLDLLHQLRTVGAQAIANGKWALPAYEQVRQTYETVRSSEDSAMFVQLAAEAGIETLDAEYENPQLGVIRYEGQTSDSRLHTRFSSEQVNTLTSKFFSKYSLDKVVSNSTKVLPATKDALVYTERSGLAVGIIRLDVDQFLDSPESDLNFDINQYRIYKQHLDAAEQFSVQRRDEISVKIFHAIHDEYVGELVANGDADGAAKVFAEILPILNEEEWKTYFIGEIKQLEYPSKNKLYHEAGDKNERVSYEFYTGIFDYRDQLGERYEEDYLKLEVALEHEDFEYAFDIASDIIQKCQDEKEPTDVHKEVAVLEDKVHKAHKANFEAARQKFEDLMAELAQTEEIQASAEVTDKLDDNLSELGEELRLLIESKLAKIKDLPQLELTTLKELVAELKGEENMKQVTEEDVLLFQHVHSGELAGKIEGEFGFALSDLSLREQYFFLNYLKRVTVAEADTMKRFTSLYGVDGMRTFLSLERGDETLGDHIVAFGAHDEVAGTVFSYYSELLDSAERAENLVREVSDCEGDACTTLAQQVRENILNRAQKDLETAVRAHDPSEVSAQIESYVAKAREYVALLQEVDSGTIECITSHELSEVDKQDMASLQQANYHRLYPNPEDEEFKETVFASLQKSFTKPNTEFNVLRHEGKIICFNRFETRTNTSGKEVTHLGSFNANPAYSGVGEIMLNNTIQERLADGRPMTAQCDPEQSIAKKYIENGFVATAVVDDLGGHADFDIWRAAGAEASLQGKQMEIAELVECVDVPGDMVVREQHDGETYPEFREGKALSRLFTYEDKTYLVFETLPADVQERFSVATDVQPQAA